MSVSRLIDSALDRSVVGGYGRPGLLVRRSLSCWPADPGRMDGQVVLVTGATGGIGLAAAQGFAALGATVHLVGRDPRRTEAAAAQVGGVAQVCDVSSLAACRDLAARWQGPLDVLVHNAGVLLQERTLSVDGVELTFATNVLGPWELTRSLSALMAPGARIVNVSSGGMYGQRLGSDLQNEDYAPVKAYARTKRAEVVLTEQWADRLQDKGIVVHAMHPGWAKTPGITESLPRFGRLARPILRTAEEGADTIVWLGASAEAGRSSGLLWMDRRARPTHLLGLNKETGTERAALWALCEELAARP
jgi:dehydrogenase/reductase SDR family protein 12